MNWKSFFKVSGIDIAFAIIFILGILWHGRVPLKFNDQKSQPAQNTDYAKSVENKKKPKSVHQIVKLVPKVAKADTTKSQEEDADPTVSVLLELLDTKKPLVNGCRNLIAVKESQLFNRGQNLKKYFFYNLLKEDDSKDPLVETAFPLLRYIFRAPGMPTVVETLIAAYEKNKSLDWLNKIKFYNHLFSVAKYLESNSKEVNSILQRTYNMHFLVRAVLVKPELTRDSATLRFCEQLENNLNESGPYDPQSAADEMLKFFNDVGISPKEVGYDPTYRSHVRIRFSENQLSIDDTWIAQLFTDDSL